MTEQPEMTSHQGRQWLAQTSGTLGSAGGGTSSQSTDPATESLRNIPIVSIPFFDTIDKTLGLVSQATGEPNKGVPAAPLGVPPSGGDESRPKALDLATLVSRKVHSPAPDISFASVKNDRSEDPNDWMEKVINPTSPREEKSKSGNSATKNHASAIDGLVDSVLERFPLAAPAILLFVGSESNPHIDETCAEVALMLSKRNVGDVLLVDSNFEGQLTSHHNLTSSAGVSEVYNDVESWDSLVVRESASGLDFLPSGKGNLDRWDGTSRVRQAAAEMKAAYQFICVSAGDAYSNASKTWSGICDGSYLIVSLNSSNERIAESAVTELQSSGARLLGCVVTDS